jgi:hypothetical protein
MIQNYHDSIAICRVFGPPDFFCTFTCNPNWPEIVNSCHGNVQRPSDISDVIVRVYHMKLEELIQDIRSGKMFGPCNAGMLLSNLVFLCLLLFFYRRSQINRYFSTQICAQKPRKPSIYCAFCLGR